MNIADTLRSAAQKLAASSPSPRLDAEVLLAHALDFSRARLIAEGRAEFDTAQQRTFDALLERRLSGEPVAYLTGEREFWSLRLAVSPAVLVPRPETELLVEQALEQLRGRLQPRVLELGTGSGAIALALASERPDARIDAVELSADAMSVAKANAASLGLETVCFLPGDWYQALPGDARYELIVSNPPYVAHGDPHLSALAHEPQQALCADDDGLACLRTIIDGAPRFLLPGGDLLLEHGAGQGAAVRELLERAAFADVRTLRDAAGLERVSIGRRAHG